jgi:hypothetical protein
MPLHRHVLISYCEFVAYNRAFVSCMSHVSVLSPSAVTGARAGGLNGQNRRYDGDYEKAMSVQTQAHQGMVVRMVRRR